MPIPSSSARARSSRWDGHQTEIVCAAFECPKEIWVRSCVGVDECPIGKDDLKIGHIVTGKTIEIRKNEASHPDIQHSAPDNGDIILIELSIDILPSQPRSDLSYTLLGVSTNYFLESAHVNGFDYAGRLSLSSF
ncbi:hypothetical protein EYZ11_011338 [Aspergillus tanneri]|uniref:Uncharacterized protein n=1 Tax=Aspergillus tanneri TaxID=1220188 RepID=A0A4S3J316_9EURO|nr:hypothetical protein EYZ11_011338 [Aspergillus tanneri]